MAKPRTGYKDEPSPGGWLPCSRCQRWAGESTEPIGGVRWAITAPFDSPKIEPGDRWVCRLCLREQDEAPTDPGHAMPDATPA